MSLAPVNLERTQENTIKLKEISRMTLESKRGFQENPSKTHVFMFYLHFTRVLAMCPRRDPAGKGGRGDRVNPIPP